MFELTGERLAECSCVYKVPAHACDPHMSALMSVSCKLPQNPTFRLVGAKH